MTNKLAVWCFVFNSLFNVLQSEVYLRDQWLRTPCEIFTNYHELFASYWFFAATFRTSVLCHKVLNPLPVKCVYFFYTILFWNFRINKNLVNFKIWTFLSIRRGDNSNFWPSFLKTKFYGHILGMKFEIWQDRFMLENVDDSLRC